MQLDDVNMCLPSSSHVLLFVVVTPWLSDAA